MDEECRFADEMSEDRSRTGRLNELLQPFILSHEERYQEAADSLIHAIESIGKHRREYLEDWLHAVQNLAALEHELPFERASALAGSEVDQDIAWPDDFRTQRFQALKVVGWSCALRGDLLGCFAISVRKRVAPATLSKRSCCSTGHILHGSLVNRTGP
jgi:hypothetical protein